MQYVFHADGSSVVVKAESEVLTPLDSSNTQFVGTKYLGMLRR
jgi:hypothetical protein